VRDGWRRSTSAAVAEGKHIASRAPLGYVRVDQLTPTRDAKGDVIRDARLVPDPETADAVGEAFKRRAGGASHGEVLAFLREATGKNLAPSAVTGILRNRAYLGEARGPGEGNVLAGAHEALVDEDTFTRVQARNGTRAPRKGSPAARALLGGLVTCASCGHKMRVLGSPNGTSYVCKAKFGSGGDCEAPGSATVDKVDKYVIDQLHHSWEDVLAADTSSTSEQAFLEAKEAVRQAEAALDEWIASTTMQVTLSTARFEQGIVARQRAVDEARRVMWELDDPGLPEVPLVYIDGKPMPYELWGDDVERDKQHLRRHIAEVTVAKADPARRRWQPIEERVTVRWR
jgi:hypothetical protein